MKNVNLTGLFLAMSAEFGVAGFELACITPVGKEPIDALIHFKDGLIGVFDLGKAEEIVKANLTGDVKQFNVSLMSGEIEVYIEFTNSTFIDELS